MTFCFLELLSGSVKVLLRLARIESLIICSHMLDLGANDLPQSLAFLYLDLINYTTAMYD